MMINRKQTEAKELNYIKNDRGDTYYSIMDLKNIIITKNNEVESIQYTMKYMWEENQILLNRVISALKIVPLSKVKN